MPKRLRPSTRSLVHRLSARSRSARSQLRRLARLRGARAAGRLSGARRFVAFLNAFGAPHTTEGAKKRRLRRGWALGPLVLVAILFLFGRRAILQRVDIESNLRRSLLPELRKQFGVDIEVGKIESDYLSRVVLHDVVIGRDKKLPLGALARVRTATLSLDVIKLVQHRDDPLSALSAVNLDSPQIYVLRDGAGKINWETILNRRPPGEKTIWNGTVDFQKGRLWYQDANIRNSSGRALIADARGAEGKLNFQGTSPTIVQVGITQTLIEKAVIRNTAASGEFEIGDNKHKPWVALSLSVPSAPAPLLAAYAFPRRDVLAPTGSIGARLELAYDAAAAPAQRLLAAGDLIAKGLTLQANTIYLPGSKTPLVLRNITGPLSFNGNTLSTAGLNLTTLDSPVKLSGSLALPQDGAPDDPVMNVLFESRALATNRLATFLPKPMAIQGGAARATLRFTGELKNARIGGIVVVPNFTGRHPQYGLLRATSLQTTLNFAGNLADTKQGTGRLNADIVTPGFDLHTAGGQNSSAAAGSGLRANLRFTLNSNKFNGGLRFSASTLRGQHAGFGSASSGPAKGFVRFTGTGQATPVAADLALTSFVARPGSSGPQFGTLRGRTLRLVTATADARRPAWKGNVYAGGIDAGAVDIASVAPGAAAQIREIGVRDLGSLEGSARFSNITSNGLRDAIINGTFHLSQATVQGTRLNDIYGQASLSNGQWNVGNARAGSEFGAFALNITTGASGLSGLQISAPRIVIDAARVNPYLAKLGIAVSGQANGRLDVQSQDSGGSAFRANFDFALPQTTVNRHSSGRAGVLLAGLTNVRLLGKGVLRRGAGNSWTWQGETQLKAGNVGLSRNLRGVRLAGFTFPAWMDGGKLLGLNLTARGGATSDDRGLTPRFNGALNLANAALQLHNPKQNSSVPVRVRNGNLVFALDSTGFQASRLTAGLESFDKPGEPGAPARVTGHLTVRRSGEMAGQLLAENIDAARTQRSLMPFLGAKSEATLTGVAFARIDMTGTTSAPRAGMQLRLYRGAIGMAENSVPIDTARLTTSVDFANLGNLPIEELTVWSRGARLKASGSLKQITARFAGRPIQTYTLNLDAEMNDVKLKDVGLLLNAGTEGDTDGLIGGQWRVTGTLASPRVIGKTSLRMAQLLGVAIDEAAADLYFENGSNGLRLGLSEITGRIGTSTFTGRLLSDMPKNLWRVQLKTSDIASARLLRTGVFLAARIGNEDLARRIRTWQNVPLRGLVRADIDIEGKFKTAGGNGQLPLLVPSGGTVKVATDNVRWKGRSIGTLTADARIVENGVQLQDLTLRRSTAVPTAAVPVSANAKADATGDEKRAGSAVNAEEEIIAPPAEPENALLQITGLLPTSSDAETLDARVKLSNERLSFVQTMLREVEGSLRKQGELVPSLDAIVNGITTLPGNLEGLLNLDARFTGSWQRPVIALETAVLDARLGTEVLPTLKTSLVLDDGAVNIQNLEIRKLTPPTPGTDEDERDTVLRVAEGGRITPGGEVSLDIELLNSNLSQLAQYIPGLKGPDGRSIMSGEISLFNIEVRGQSTNPVLTGSIEAQSLVYRNYSLDRLRLTRFDIADGRLAVEPGSLTVVKGGFQSSAAWGNIPWDWKRPGPVNDGPLEVHLPLQTRDFGALAGTFIPALAEVAADNFNGTIDISGTLDSPKFAGELAVENGRFLAKPAALGTDFGINGLTGRIRFIDGNNLIFDNVHGTLASAGSIAAPSTNNLPAAQRNQRAAERAAVNPTGPPPADISGEFALAGKVALDLDPRNFDEPGLSVAAHRYDLQFSLKKAGYSSSTLSGLRDVNLTAAWKTGEGDPALEQFVSWQLQAAGSRSAGKVKGKAGGPAGELTSVAQIRLAPDFASSFDAFLHSNFKGDLTLKGFGFAMKDVATGSLDGALQLSNVAPGGTIAIPALRQTVSARVDPRLTPIQRAAATRENKVLGIGGTIVLSDTELMGAPIGGVGVASVLPEAPVMGIKLLIGRNVRFVTPTLRADFDGSFDVAGTPREPLVAGEIETKNGQIRFPSVNARISEGRIRFNIARDAATDTIRSSADIDATARGQSGRYQITLGLHGPLDFGSNNIQNLRVDVTSNPPLSQDEAFAQLTGTSLRDLDNGGGNLPGSKVNQAYAGAVLSLISAPLFAGIERSLEEVLGLSSITLDYRFNEPLSVQFGKAVGDRVYISYRRSLSENKLGESTSYTFRIDYRIKGDYQLGLQFDDRKRQQISIDKTWRF